MVTLPASVVRRYPRFSLYNSPYPEHDAGCAVDFYPETPDDDAPSPVAGEVVETRTVRCPPKPYAADYDHLVVVDTGTHYARVLHVDPSVDAGDEVAVGDSLGTMVRSGFFAPWVDNHVHLGFRERDANPVRASGSLSLSLDVPVEPVTWDGTGEVVETGETYVVLDAPDHPSSGIFAALATDDGLPLDGGLVHYSGGGVLGAGADAGDSVSLLGTPVGDVCDDRRTVAWRDVAVSANGTRCTGLSLFASRDSLGTKVVCPDHDFAVGDALRVRLDPTENPVHLG
ncbi:hypothetical protein [Halospeciosus flavus]|uniref:Uncharacterized protein n=1 Tax=Halospeciosus flavus TaxID=3032283 RepID=A0ABD5Z6T5_9EURY|nr:hypothetical protein [Halospeciosus flavus]